MATLTADPFFVTATPAGRNILRVERNEYSTCTLPSTFGAPGPGTGHILTFFFETVSGDTNYIVNFTSVGSLVSGTVISKATDRFVLCCPNGTAGNITADVIVFKL